MAWITAHLAKSYKQRSCVVLCAVCLVRGFPKEVGENFKSRKFANFWVCNTAGISLPHSLILLHSQVRRRPLGEPPTSDAVGFRHGPERRRRRELLRQDRENREFVWTQLKCVEGGGIKPVTHAPSIIGPGTLITARPGLRWTGHQGTEPTLPRPDCITTPSVMAWTVTAVGELPRKAAEISFPSSPIFFLKGRTGDKTPLAGANSCWQNAFPGDGPCFRLLLLLHLPLLLLTRELMGKWQRSLPPAVSQVGNALKN